MIYLDNAATSLIKPTAVYHAVTQAMLHASSPGRGAHPSALRAAEIVYRCREAAATLFHMHDPSRVVFTSNATHALNIAIHSMAFPGCRVLVSGFEHNAVTRPLRAAGAQLIVAGRTLFDPQALLTDFSSKIKSVDLVVCTHVSNVFGFILPMDEIAALCEKQHVPLIIDASQSAGLVDIDISHLRPAFVAMPGHKALLGPQGTGILLCGNEGTPLLYGGTGSNSAAPGMPDDLPERLEAGTMNVPGIAGLMAGITYVSERGPEIIREEEESKLRQMAVFLQKLPRLKLYAEREYNQCGILSFEVDGVDSESFCEALSQREIAARAGLHCAPLAHESAGTLEKGTIRLSLSPFTNEDQISHACRVIRELVEV